MSIIRPMFDMSFMKSMIGMIFSVQGHGAPEIRVPTGRGLGRLHREQLRAGAVEPQFAYISRQVRRREQRKAMKRAMKAVA